MEEVEVTSGGSLAGKTVGALRETGVFVLAIVTESKSYEANPRADRVLKAGETLIVSGSAPRLKELRGV
jgi:K+/H+ antiporter YhaU regulatory subunit KhtT